MWQRESEWRNSAIKTAVKHTGVCERLTRKDPGALDGKWGRRLSCVGLVEKTINQTTNQQPHPSAIHSENWLIQDTVPTNIRRLLTWRRWNWGHRNVPPPEVVQSLSEGTS